jgi:LysM repeat protein
MNADDMTLDEVSIPSEDEDVTAPSEGISEAYDKGYAEGQEAANKALVEENNQFREINTELVKKLEKLEAERLTAQSQASEVHEVVKGDTIRSIAKLYGTSYKAIQALNPKYNLRYLRKGTTLRVK